MADTAFALLKVAVKNLYKFYKIHKDYKRELQEVGNFFVDLGANSPILNANHDSSKRLNHVKNTLRGKLESASKEVEELSSRNLTDFLHSDERLRKIQGVRRKVKEAMEEANTQLLVYGLEFHEGNRKRLDELLNRIPRKPAKDAAVPPRSKSTPGRAVLSNKAPPSSMPRAAIARPRRDKTVELFVPMDSDKQARDVVEKLKALPGVKNAISDQTSKKVSVVPLKGATLNTDQLLQSAHLENKFVVPTLWSKRPR